jgi:hypothetical protein
MDKIYNILNNIEAYIALAKQKTDKKNIELNEKSNSDNVFDLVMSPSLDDNNEDSSSIEDESLNQYKSESLAMALGSLNKILHNVYDILNNSDLDRVKQNLTEPWLQGMIAVVDDNVSTIHDFVKFYDSEDDSEETEAARKEIDHHRKHHHKQEKKTVNISYRVLPGLPTRINPSHDEHNEHESHEEPNETTEPTNETNETPSDSPSMPSAPASNRPGLWENIRKKKEREGKKYKPAKRGDKDRPDSDTWNKLTKDTKK